MSNKELQEAPMVEQRLDHTIKPRKIKKVTGVNSTLASTELSADRGNVISRKKPPIKKKKNVVHSDDHRASKKRKQTQARTKFKKQRILKDKKIIKLGDDVMKPRPKQKKVLAPLPDVKAKTFDSLDEIPVGTQIPAGINEDVMMEEDIFSLLDLNFLYATPTSANIEHSGVTPIEGTFAPAPSRLLQNADEIRRDVNELGSNPRVYDMNNKPTDAEIGKYDNLLDVRAQRDYMRQSVSNSINPAFPISNLRKNPGNSSASFLRVHQPGFTVFKERAGENNVY